MRLPLSAIFSACFFSVATMAAFRVQAEDMPVTIAAGVRDPIYTHLYVAYKNGYLKEQGLEPKLVITGSGSRAAQLMVTGQADATIGNPEHVLVISNEGRATVMLAAFDQRNTFGNILVNSDSGLKELSDLKNKPIGITATGGGAYYYARFLFQHSGLAPSEIKWINLGSVANLEGAMRSKRVSAVVASLSMVETAKTQKYGYTLFDSRDTDAWNKVFGGPMPSSVVYALADNVKKKPELYRRVVKAMIQADDFIKKNSAETIAEAIVSEMGGQSVPSLVHAIDAYKKTYWRPSGLKIEEPEYKRWQQFAMDNELLSKQDLDKYGYANLVKDVGAFQ